MSAPSKENLPAGGAVVAFVGENENGILRHLSNGLMGLIKPLGYDGHIIELGDPEWPSQLDLLVKQGITMAWGHAGVGARLEVDRKNFWELVKVPFVSVLADPPCWQPRNHAINSRYVANAYLYREWLSVQQRFIRSSQLSALVQGGLVPNPLSESMPWRSRPRRMVLIKTGGDPATRRETWAGTPRRMRAVLEDAAAVSLSRGTADVTDVVLDAMAANQVSYEARTDILFGLMAEVDRYVRDKRSTALVTALLDIPADIYGRGWDHVSHRTTRARFHPAFDASELPTLYAETQFMLNTTPNFSSGVHERVAYGLDARCCVISDENDFMREKFADIPTYFPIDPADPCLSGHLATLYNDPTDYTRLAEPASKFAAQAFDGVHYMKSLLELADEIRTGEQFADFQH